MCRQANAGAAASLRKATLFLAFDLCPHASLSSETREVMCSGVVAVGGIMLNHAEHQGATSS